MGTPALTQVDYIIILPLKFRFCTVLILYPAGVSNEEEAYMPYVFIIFSHVLYNNLFLKGFHGKLMMSQLSISQNLIQYYTIYGVEIIEDWLMTTTTTTTCPAEVREIHKDLYSWVRFCFPYQNFKQNEMACTTSFWNYAFNINSVEAQYTS